MLVTASPTSLVADIGGTRARFALVDATGRIHAEAELPVAAHASPESALATYLNTAGRPRLTAAALAIAAPVGDGDVPLTNAHWCFRREAIAACLTIPASRLVLLNDFTALALALPDLAPAELRQVGGGDGVASAAKAVLGAGTGLGVSGLLPVHGGWQPLAGEGGHVTLAAADDREAAILTLARREFAHVSAERLLSGSGLPLLHRLVGEVDGTAAAPTAGSQRDATPALIAAAVAGDAACRTTVTTFCALLGGVAGNLALTLGARGGVYLGGGLLPRLGPLLDASPFRARFEAKGRFASYLAAIPAYVILAPSPALRGAARALPPP